jgi:hypothetical protein
LGIPPQTESPSYAVLSAVLIFQFCEWEEKLRKRIPSYCTINLMFEDILFADNEQFLKSASNLNFAILILDLCRAYMGPLTKKKFSAHSLRKNSTWAKAALIFIYFLTHTFDSTKFRYGYHNKRARTLKQHFIYFQKSAVMESGSFLTPEEAARMGGENPAAAAAVKGDNPGYIITGNSPKPAKSLIST